MHSRWLVAVAIQERVEGVGIEIRTERHSIASEIGNKKQGAEEKFEDESNLPNREERG